MDSDGYISSNTMDKRRTLCNTIDGWIEIDTDGKKWIAVDIYYHIQWIRDDSNGMLRTEMDTDG